MVITRRNANTSILVVDDDPKILAFVTSHLKAQGYEVTTARDGQEAIEQAALSQPDLIMLDLSMPVMDGIAALERLREWFSGPIIILSATHEEREKVHALDLGADDYLTKPFSIEELLARVRAALRRAERWAAHAAEEPIIDAGRLRIDLAQRTVTADGQEVALTPTEYELLRHLASNAGKVLSHRELLQRVWGPEYGDETEYLRTFIKQLRRKLEPDPSRPQYIRTQPGIGYRFVSPHS
jgi:two-component system KDP operon response regulator KdpE